MLSPRSQAVNSPDQLELSINCAPRKVRRFGLMEGHAKPLVACGRPATRSYLEFRVSAEEAWLYQRLELRTPNSWPSLCFDLKGGGPVDVAMDMIMAGDLNVPNWMVRQADGQAASIVYNLSHPVLRGPQAKENPLKLYSRISEYFGLVLGVDGDNGVLVVNPMSRGHGSGYKTEWMRRRPYPLFELSETVPRSWRSPKTPKTHIGRTNALFQTCLKWAGSARNLPLDVLSFALIENEGYNIPLSLADVQGVSLSIERYRSKWEFYTPEEAAAMGRESGRIRRDRTRARDSRIVQGVMRGEKQADVGVEFGLTQHTISRIICRDLPLWAKPNISTACPWESEGISRRTWYYRRARQ